MKFKYAKGFSLIELLIVLIILSLVLSAFIPLITKKLKASDITVGSFGKISNNDGITIQRNVTKQDCKNLNAVYVPAGVNVPKPLCVMKYNIGDVGNEDWTGVKKCQAGKNCEVQNGLSEEVKKENLQAACWVATSDNNTADTGCNNNFGGYDGCKRTVCNWTGANQMCTNIGWRLPTYGELSAFTNDTYSSKKAFESVNGSLMFCDDSSSSISPVCTYIENNCSDTFRGNCYSYHIWSSSFETATKVGNRYLAKKWIDHTGSLSFAFSARCVIDTINETVEKPKEELSCNCQNGICETGKMYCTSCNDGYSLYNNQCVQGNETNCYDYFCTVCKTTEKGTCSLCKNGYVLHDGKCYFGTLEGCNNPTFDETYQTIICADCKNGYTKCNSGSCMLTSKLNKPCPVNSIKIGCTCVAQYNIGDGYYKENLASINSCSTKAFCNVINGQKSDSSAKNVTATCWLGTTTLEGENNCNSNFGGYSGCKRTVCNWIGAQKLCENIGWRLPNILELDIFANSVYSNPTIGSNGLMLCDHSFGVVSTTSAVCTADVFGGCTGSADNNCYPFHVWSSSFLTNSHPYDRALYGSWATYDTAIIGSAFSARCVKDL